VGFLAREYGMRYLEAMDSALQPYFKDKQTIPTDGLPSS
jgi:hypothetical protein